MAWTINNGKLYFNTELYTGNASTLNITGLDFQPDLCWLKIRSAADNHALFDSVRGVKKRIASNLTAAEINRATALTSFNSDGFTLGDNSETNAPSGTYASWNWKAGTSFTNDASATGIGTIDSTGSVNDTAGFSIVKYTGTGSAGTIKHGLSSKPSMIIFKNLSAGRSWMVYHQSLGATKFLYLDVTDAVGTNSGFYNDTEPTSSVFSVGTANNTNYNGEAIIAYCFSEKQGYSKFGSYTGNGSTDGTFIYTGFKPAFIMTKQTDGADWWVINDTKRDTFNTSTLGLRPNDTAAESSDTAWTKDILSNGFKQRTTNSGSNGSGNSYIYMAFAENPFTSSAGTPVTAR